VPVIIAGEAFDSLLHNAVIPLDQCTILEKSHSGDFAISAGLFASSLSLLCWCFVIEQEIVGVDDVGRVVAQALAVVVSQLTPKAAAPAPVCSF
jgi:hypothetical protein